MKSEHDLGDDAPAILGVPTHPEPVSADGGRPTAPEPPARSQWQLVRRRFFRHRLAMVGGAVLIALCVVCFGAKTFAFYDKNHQDLLLGPTSPSKEHWMGTDQIGRDLLTEILYAGRVSLKIGLAVALISTVIGTIIGSIAGYFGKLSDQLLMRTTDLFLVVPQLAILAIALKYFGQSVNPIIFVLAGLGWTYIARVVRGQVLSVKEKEFVEAARASGASSARIIVRHILPNCIGPILVNATLAIAAAIVTESTLSFLGFGIIPPDTSWGNMLSSAEGNFNNNTHLLYYPGLMILVTVLCVNFLGDGLRDAFDPQSRH
ncbi:MAG: ABC transporter permease [Acidimicrobiales bacterium]